MATNTSPVQKRGPIGRMIDLLKGRPTALLDPEATADQRYARDQTLAFGRGTISAFERLEKAQVRTSPTSNQTKDTMGLHGELVNAARAIERRNKTTMSAFELAPELKQASRILISSTMSPTDMQIGRQLPVTVNHRDLTETQTEKISEVLTEAMHARFKLAQKLPVYLENMFFIHGAQPILVMPRRNLEALTAAMQPENFSTEGAKIILADGFLDNYNKWIADDADAMFQVEQFAQAADVSTRTLIDYTGATVKKVLTMTAKDGDHQVAKISVSFNPSDINKTTPRATADSKAVHQLFLGYDEDHPVRPNNSDPKTMLTSLDERETKGPPLIIELNSASVIPVSVPGSPHAHVAYFVVVDDNGNPYVPTAGEVALYANPTDRLLDQALATYNSSDGDGAVKVFRIGTDRQDKWELMSRMFDVALKGIIGSELAASGRSGFTAECNSALSNCLFFRMLHHHNVKLVYVPADLMVYYATEFHDNGVGKSLIDGIIPLMSLRATLMVSNVMASIQQAVRQEKLTVDVDPMNVQVEHIIEMVRKTFIDKHSGIFGDNLSSIYHNILANSVTVVPRGLSAGDVQFNIERETQTGTPGIQRVDTDMFDRLTEMIISWLMVPYSALNKLSEDEFSRSVATNNLMLSNNIRMIQNVLAPLNSKFVRLVALFDPEIRSAIEDIIADTGSGKTRLTDILDTVAVILPAPNIAADKHQFGELDDFIGVAGKLVESLFPDSMVVDNAELDLKPLLGQFREVAKASLVREYISAMGADTFDIGTLAELKVRLDETINDSSKLLFDSKAGLTKLSVSLTELLAQGKAGAAALPTDEAAAGTESAAAPEDESGDGGMPPLPESF